MKKFYSLFLTMLLAFAGAGNIWADTYPSGTTVDVSDLMTGDILEWGVTVTNDNSIGLLFDVYVYESQMAYEASPKDYSNYVWYTEITLGSGDYLFDEGTTFKVEVDAEDGEASDYSVYIIAQVASGNDILVNFSLEENYMYYTTFFSSKDWIVPLCNGRPVDVYAVSTVNGNEIVLGSPIATSGNVVKGGTAVIMACMQSGSTTVKEATSGTPIVGPAGNLLEGTDVDTPNIHEDGYVYYILSKADGVPGFYYQKGCADGSYVNNGAHKAYLRLKKTNGGNSNGFTFRFDGNPTSVQSIATQENATIYNLQGQRVSGKAAGVYVKNGKKFIVR